MAKSDKTIGYEIDSEVEMCYHKTKPTDGLFYGGER